MANLLIEKISKVKRHRHYDKAMHWTKLISITGGAQIAVQLSAMLGGIVVLWLLPKEDFAYYSIANNILGTLTLLSDGGITTGVLSEGGAVWNDKKKLGVVISTGMHLRKKFAIYSLIISIPILSYLLLHHGAGWLTVVLIAISIIPAFFASLSDLVYEIVPKLHQDIKPLQKNQFYVAIGRLLLTAVTIFIFPFSYLALLAAGIPRVIGNIKLKKIAEKNASLNEDADPQVRKNIISIVKKVLPSAAYYCVSGQITSWLIQIVGTTNAVADIGALSKLSAIFTVYASVVAALAVPRFARMPPLRGHLVMRIFYLMLAAGFLSISTVFIIWLFPDIFLMILGSKYDGLQNELVVSIIGSAIGFLFACIFGINLGRGWIINPIISIVMNALSIVIGVLIFDVSTIIGVLYFGIFIVTVELVVHASFTVYKLYKLDK